MNLGATLTIQSNQADLFTIILSVINCASFSDTLERCFLE